MGPYIIGRWQRRERERACGMVGRNPKGRFIQERKKISIICKILKNSEVDDYF